jgi:uncharacterized protein (TIGR02679 family)
VSERPSLEDPELGPVWDAVRSRLERSGVGNRGRVRLPEMSSHGQFLLNGLMGARTGSALELGRLEHRLRQLGFADDLTSALSRLGHPVSPEPARRRAVRHSGLEARAAARRAAASWGEPWAEEWVDGIVRAGVLAGLDVDRAVQLVRDARAVLERISAGTDASDRLSRVDLAAQVLGSSHALDWGTREEAAVTRALGLRFGGSGRQAWENAGVHLDLVSAPVLTWGLHPVSSSPLAELLGAAEELGLPLHLSQLALRRHPVRVAEEADVLVAENPRLVEAAAEKGCPFSVVALNGNPAGAARLLVEQLLSCGAHLRYHGDFDAAGLRICARMHRLGLVPWRMDRGSHLAALGDADRQGARLPVDTYRSPPTPWDPDLQEAFDEERRIVHEERLLGQLLT